MMVEVFGPGCMRCEQTYKIIQGIIIDLGRDDIGITKISDPAMFAARGVMMTPAVIVDGVLKCQGRIPKADEVRGWLAG
jgi:small redox-active disulfide protein 2